MVTPHPLKMLPEIDFSPAAIFVEFPQHRAGALQANTDDAFVISNHTLRFP
jgi:hypothetical protein